MVEDTSGNLFGTASQGGASNYGTVFEVQAGSGIITTLTSFNGADGAYPAYGLLEDGSGNLFGTTTQSLPSGPGTVFELTKGAGGVYTFSTRAAGASFDSGLIEDGAGNLIGATTTTLRELKAGSGTVTTLATFNGTNGYFPSGVIEDSNGNFFGTTHQGGPSNGGTVFEVAAGSGTVTTLATFSAAGGAKPNAGLIEDSNGNFFGTTSRGGANGWGTIFEVAAGSGTVTTLASVTAGYQEMSTARLVEDSSGDLFGTTYYGGAANGRGSVFEVKAGSGTITTLVSFNGSNGAFPVAGLIEDGSGNLFGTTSQGGANSDGTVFEVAPSTGAITTIASFNGTNGSSPRAGLVEDKAGDLFGTTSKGGADSDGTVFEIIAGSGGTITTLASFNGANGNFPETDLVEDGNGNLFGSTLEGGASNGGAVFELVAGSGAITTLASFNGTTLEAPSGLLEDTNGNFFGTTIRGGANGDGTVFELAAGSGNLTTLASFNTSTGSEPNFGLVEDANGNLFGTTALGGANGVGTVFEVYDAQAVSLISGDNQTQ